MLGLSFDIPFVLTPFFPLVRTGQEIQIHLSLYTIDYNIIIVIMTVVAMTVIFDVWTSYLM